MSSFHTIMKKLLIWVVSLSCFFNLIILLKMMETKQTQEQTQDQTKTELDDNTTIEHYTKNHILGAIQEPLSEISFSGYKHVNSLKRCQIRKVASSASSKLHVAFEKLPNPPNSDYTMSKDSFSFALVRDPLARLYSGYWNKCLNQIEREPTQCPNFRHARQNPPLFSEWLKAQYQDNFRAMHQNEHFKPMSKVCNLTEYDIVLHLESPTINSNLSKLWKALGLPHGVVDEAYPPLGTKRTEFYYSNASYGIQQYYNCSTLKLALPMLQEDYEGPYKQYFPFPLWVNNDTNRMC